MLISKFNDNLRKKGERHKGESIEYVPFFEN
jgi:hypothetical protein